MQSMCVSALLPSRSGGLGRAQVAAQLLASGKMVHEQIAPLLAVHGFAVQLLPCMLSTTA
jgi:hypothetical protein